MNKGQALRFRSEAEVFDEAFIASVEDRAHVFWIFSNASGS